MTRRKLQQAVVPIQDAGGPWGPCHMFGCEDAGEEFELFLHAGEGDESPEVIQGVILCRSHGRWFDGRMARLVAEKPL